MKNKPIASKPERAATPPATTGSSAADAASLGAEMARTWQTLAGLSLPLPALAQLQADYLHQATAL